MNQVLTPVRLLPRHKLSMEKWYALYEDTIQHIVDVIIGALDGRSLEEDSGNRVYTRIFDADAMQLDIVRHLYATSYNSDKYWP